MDVTAAFASVDNYAARYGPPVDSARTTALLNDASNVLLSAYESHFNASYVNGVRPAFDRSAEAVCCAMVQRAMNVPDGFAGATQLSQGGGGYTASVSFGGALGDLYLGKSDMRKLGLDGSRMGSITPMMRDA